MNPLPKVSDVAQGSAGKALAKEAPLVPFPYVVLGGRDDLAEAAGGEVAAPILENERAWFVAHVDLGAPRWVNAREALVKSLAIEEPMAPAPAQDDAAWDGGAPTLAPLDAAQVAMRAPVIPAPAPAPALAPAPAIKLRAKRRAPSLNTNPPMLAPVEPVVGAEDAGDSVLPLLKEGLAPLVPIPGLGGAGGFVAPPLVEDVVAARAPARQSAGRFKKAVGMVLLCGLLGVAGILLFQELMPSGARASIAEPVVEAKVVPEASAPVVAAVPASPAANEPAVASAPVAEVVAPAAPAHASPEFANYVSSLRVSGVSLGASPRALINGRMVHVGDLIDPALGVRLVAVDGAARNLVFEDNSTALVRARY